MKDKSETPTIGLRMRYEAADLMYEICHIKGFPIGGFVSALVKSYWHMPDHSGLREFVDREVHEWYKLKNAARIEKIRNRNVYNKRLSAEQQRVQKFKECDNSDRHKYFSVFKGPHLRSKPLIKVIKALGKNERAGLTFAECHEIAGCAKSNLSQSLDLWQFLFEFERSGGRILRGSKIRLSTTGLKYLYSEINNNTNGEYA